MSYWILPLTALIGVGIGLRYRPAAVAALSLAFAASLSAIALVRGNGFGWTVVAIGATLASLQGGYLVGTAITHR